MRSHCKRTFSKWSACETSHLHEKLEEARAGIGFSTRHYHKSCYHRTTLVSQVIINCLELSWEPNHGAATEGDALGALYMHLAAMCNYDIVRVLGAGDRICAPVTDNRPATLRREIAKLCHILTRQLTTLGSIADGLAEGMPLAVDAGWRKGPLHYSKRPPTKSGYRFYLFDLFRHIPYFRRLIAGFFAITPNASSSTQTTKETSPCHSYSLRAGSGQTSGLKAYTKAWHKYADGSFSGLYHPCTVTGSAGGRYDVSFDF